MTLTDNTNAAAQGFNRTFMELKFYWQAESAKQQRGFNRTFMELKCDRT